ncbi:modification methylase [Paenibacillus sp. ACRRX]|uniref:DNA methyltransferase n=1 Tax=Paenibacillus sp. ACRRX TaxID=2918206 RepID=UPI001EF735F1|nr:DNA methyltransferase [Paenibacillus sp. ACRRX]MCG7410823.1 modification methylase [Paenibacillus sp. ACRRX]
MSVIQNKLDSYGGNFWDFENFKTNGIHKIANYPAMMVAPMQHKLIEDLYEFEGNIDNIFDPFHGSGTTLVEGDKFGMDLVGIDINPLANLITKVKLYGVNFNTIYNSIEKVIKNINKFTNIDIEPMNFPNINKWFREDIIKDLTIIRESIVLEKNEKNRLYFWSCFSDIVRKFSNTRSSTFKLHIKEQEKINLMQNTVISDFIKIIKERHHDLHPESSTNKKIIQGDSLFEMRKIDSNSIDLICTSPPYGDNGTTVTYGQFSILSLFWIDRSDLSISDDALLSNYSAIDNLSLGGRKKEELICSTPTLSRYLNSISDSKKMKVITFFNDYFKALEEMIRVLKSNHLMILTLGNRRVDYKEIKLDEITSEFTLSNNMTLEAKLKREIPYKRIPRRISKVGNLGAVSSMNTETVLILRKK